VTSKKAVHVNSGAISSFYVGSGAIIFKSKHVRRQFCSDFQGILEGSQRFCPDFMGFCPDFHQIKTYGGEVVPPASLHQWLKLLDFMT